MPGVSLQDYLHACREAVDRELDRLLPAGDAVPGTLHSAMRHSMFAGGKRIRPILAIAAAEACDGPPGIEAAACALECVHTYSLIHDDLPAMDNDDFRRGQPTCHKVYGEAMAILAGDALLTIAFQIITALDASADARVALAAELSAAAGTEGGMIAGQVADLESEGKPPTAAQVEFIHRAKTAAMIRASVRFGALFADADTARYEALSAFGGKIGLAFQIVDDILDVVSTSEELGKTAGKDQDQSKATYPAVFGIPESSRQARQCLAQALDALSGFGDSAWALREIAGLIVSRSN